MKRDELTYAQAMERLDAIVSRLERGDVSVDELSASVKEGVRLVTWCRKRLRAAQDEIETALKAMDAGDDVKPAGTPPKTAPEKERDLETDPFA